MIKKQVKWMKFLWMICLLYTPFDEVYAKGQFLAKRNSFAHFASPEFSKNTKVEPLSDYFYDANSYSSLVENGSIFRLIQGRVTDVNGNTLPGVSINIEGTTKGTTTNSNGEFSIDANDDAILVFSFVGFKPQREVVGTRATIDVVLT